MTPDSPEIKYDKVADRRERPVIMFPHNRVANSPGNPAWVTQKKFGPFAEQMLIGDQTQSNLLRVALQKVGDVEQGSVMPFFDGLESGVMRPVFLPDGSLLLGQTGRGWQAKGGKVAALQHVTWDGKTVAPQIVAMIATPQGFRIDLTQPLGDGVSEAILGAALSLESWVYRDAPDYAHPSWIFTMARPRVISQTASPSTSSWRRSSEGRAPAPDLRVTRARVAGAVRCECVAELNAYCTLHVFPAMTK
jgi:hypothetical protein